METDRLKYFAAIVETGSLTKASELLGISHSGLSKALAVLQDEIGVQLVRPQGRGLEITEEGLLVYEKIPGILNRLESLGITLPYQEQWIRIGLSEVLSVACAQSICQALPGNTQLVNTNAGELEKLLLEKSLDFGYSFIPQPHPEIDYLKVTSIPFNVYANSKFNLESAGNLPFVVPTSAAPSNPMGYKHRDGWPRDVPRTIGYEVNSFDIGLEVALSGQACIYMPDFVATLVNKRVVSSRRVVAIASFKKAKTKRDIYLVKPKNRDESKSMKTTCRVLRQLGKLV